MGYDIDIKVDNEEHGEHIYMTYNHAKLFTKYNIYPRDFNGMKVKDIIPRYMEAKKKLEDDGYSSSNIIDISFKYMGNYMYKESEKVILDVVNNTLRILVICDPEAIWESD